MNEDSLINGNTLCSDPGETALLTARIVGTIEGLSEIDNIEEQLIMDNEKEGDEGE